MEQEPHKSHPKDKAEAASREQWASSKRKLQAIRNLAIRLEGRNRLAAALCLSQAYRDAKAQRVLPAKNVLEDLILSKMSRKHDGRAEFRLSRWTLPNPNYS